MNNATTMSGWALRTSSMNSATRRSAQRTASIMPWGSPQLADGKARWAVGVDCGQHQRERFCLIRQLVQLGPHQREERLVLDLPLPGFAAPRLLSGSARPRLESVEAQALNEAVRCVECALAAEIDVGTGHRHRSSARCRSRAPPASSPSSIKTADTSSKFRYAMTATIERSAHSLGWRGCDL